MKSSSEVTKILSPANQLTLYGYEEYFNFFIKLFEKKVMPNSFLLSGPKGLGKSTFAYHIFNSSIIKLKRSFFDFKNF